MADMIALDRLSVTFMNRHQAIHAVSEVTLSVAEGETFGIVGESGSGKTTVLKAIAGLEAPSSGTISLAGRAVTPKRSREQRKLLQYVFQDPYASLHPRQTVDEALLEPLYIHGIGGAE